MISDIKRNLWRPHNKSGVRYLNLVLKVTNTSNQIIFQDSRFRVKPIKQTFPFIVEHFFYHDHPFSYAICTVLLWGWAFFRDFVTWNWYLNNRYVDVLTKPKKYSFRLNFLYYFIEWQLKYFFFLFWNKLRN